CGPKNFLNENDKLRTQNLHLKQKIEQLKNDLQLQKGRADTLKKKLHPAPVNMPQAQIPVMSRIELSRFSGITENHDGQPIVRLYVRTLDQKGRMMPVAGKAKLTGVAIPKSGKPEVIAEKSYTPGQLD